MMVGHAVVKALAPTSWVFLSLLVVAFAAALVWLIKLRHLALRTFMGALALGVSTFFGAALVNHYYSYYTTWGSLVADLRGSGVVAYQPGLAPHPRHPAPWVGDDTKVAVAPAGSTASPPATPTTTTPAQSSPPPVAAVPVVLSATAAMTGTGKVVQLDLHGTQSGITRTAFVYLPPQYFDPAFANVSFPVLELIHGEPGTPTDWIYGLHVPDLMNAGVAAGTIGPMVVVMPTAFDGAHGSDCVNVVNGPQNDTYLSADVAAAMVQSFRVLPPGQRWAIGGLSSGGFCAANLALRHPGRYAAVASMAGFYSVAADVAVLSGALGASSDLLLANDPLTLAADLSRPLPRFWIMAGSGRAADVAAAQQFQQLLTRRRPITYVIQPGGGHTLIAWRKVMPGLLAWSWRAVAGKAVDTAVSPPTPTASGKPVTVAAAGGSAVQPTTHSATPPALQPAVRPAPAKPAMTSPPLAP